MFEEREFGGYKLIRKLAASASSEVYLGLPKSGPLSGRPVVIKKLIPDLSQSEIFVDLLRNEARLGEQMNHPNIVRIYESGSIGEELFLVMEFVDGLDLWRFLRRMRKAELQLPQIQAMFITAEVLKALQYLHNLRDSSGTALGLVHHDVSPSNILLSRIGEVKLGDLGIAFSRHKDLPDSDRKTRFRGKVHYISPEQIKGGTADARSDIFSVGVMMAELLVGRRPFEGPTDLSILINIKDGRSRIMTDSMQGIPRSLHDILFKALANGPEERYQTAGEMLSAIEIHAGVDKLFDAGIHIGETVNRLIRDVDRTPPPRPAPVFIPRDEVPADDLSISQGPGEVVSIQPGSMPLDGESPSDLTPIHPVKEFLVKKADGQIVGSMPMTAIIESIIADRISEDDLVSVGGKPFQAVGLVPEFARHLPSVTPTTKIHDLGQPDRRGLLGEEESVAQVFHRFFQRKDTGLAIFECASVRKEIFVEEGAPSYASSNLAGELLGEFLVRKGFLSRIELELALAMMDRFGGHLGDTLVGLDILDSITLLGAITEQIKERIFDLFTWESGTYAFFKHAKYVKEGFRLAADPLELIRDGYILAARDEETAAWYEASKTRLFFLAENPAVIDDWKIEVPHRTTLLLLEKPCPLFDLENRSASLDEAGWKRLKKLIRFGLEMGFIKEVK